jgi:hypothetical protein
VQTLHPGTTPSGAERSQGRATAGRTQRITQGK